MPILDRDAPTDNPGSWHADGLRPHYLARWPWDWPQHIPAAHWYARRRLVEERRRIERYRPLIQGGNRHGI
jgi:hypothetical protein